MSDTGQRKSPGNGAGQPSIADSNGGSEANEATMERLFHAHYRELARRARRWVGPQDAEDVVQDVFRYYWQRINGEGIPEDILARMRRRTMHRCFNLRRKLDRCELWEPGAFDFVVHISTRDTLRIQEEVERLFERVSEPESKGLIRCLLKGMTLVEIAEAEEIAVGTVKWRIHALKKKMRIQGIKPNL